MTIYDATRIAEEWLLSKPFGNRFSVSSVEPDGDLAIVYWTSRDGEPIAGNSPLLIDSKSQTVHPIGTARPIQYYINNFRITGDPHIEPSEIVKISAWRPGAQTVSAITLLRELTDNGLARSKKFIDTVLDGREIIISPRHGVTADEICTKLDSIGFIAEKVLCSSTAEAQQDAAANP